MAGARSSFHDAPRPPSGDEERLAWLRLLRSRRVGPATFWRLLGEFGSAAAALEELPAVARAAGARDYAPCPPGVARAEMRAGRAAGARLLLCGEPAYPAALAQLPDPPPLLWALGDVALLARPCVAIVGARNASSLGLRMAQALATGLGEEGITVVSGLARGVDAAAHRGALATGTIAVMAGGVDRIYPPENGALGQQIGAQGLRISDQPMGIVPQARHFPRRNRIVAGLARAVVVVEAAARSGSLITAREALEMGREVLAVPGHPLDPRASGCNMLLRDGAQLVRHAADVIEALAAQPHDLPPPAPRGHTSSATRAPRLPLPHPTVARPTAEPGSKPRPRPAAPDSAAQGSAAPNSTAPAGPAACGTESRALAPAGRESQAHPFSPGTIPRPSPRHSPAQTAALHERILARLSPAPLCEDQLIRDLGAGAAEVGQQLLFLELDGRIERRPGGLVSLAV